MSEGNRVAGQGGWLSTGKVYYGEPPTGPSVLSFVSGALITLGALVSR